MDSRYSAAAGPHLPHLAAWQDKLAIGGETGTLLTLLGTLGTLGSWDTALGMGTLVTLC